MDQTRNYLEPGFSGGFRRLPLRQDIGSPTPRVITMKATGRARERKLVVVSADHLNENRDDVHMLNIFPKEIWTLILDEVLRNDTNDFVNVCNSSLFLRDILQPMHTQLLFSEVLEVLFNNTHGIYPKPEYQQDAAAPIPAWKLPRAPIKYPLPMPMLRAVCHTWTIAVDHFFQNFSHFFEMNLMYGQLMDKWLIDAFYQIDGSLKINQFLEHFGETHTARGVTEDRTPFVGRAMSLCSHERRTSFTRDITDFEINNRNRHRARAAGPHRAVNFLTAITNLLLMYGRHVWYCTIDIEDEFETRCQYYLKLKQWLELMPNLKVIRVISKILLDADRFPRSLPETELNQLQLSVIDNPLPKLDQLEFIYSSNLPHPIVHALVGKNSHISTLEIDRKIDLPLVDYDSIFTQIQTLTQLSLQIFDEALFIALKSSQEGWKLTKIHLDFKDCPYLPWNTIYTTLETKWGSTLTNLSLKLPEARTEDTSDQITKKCSQWKLNLPLMKSFKVKFPNFSTLDFILPMKGTLEELDVTVAWDYDMWKWRKTLLGELIENRQIIQFVGYFNRLLESNVWVVVPKLKRLSFVETYLEMLTTTFVRYNWYSYTRNQWEWYTIITTLNAEE